MCVLQKRWFKIIVALLPAVVLLLLSFSVQAQEFTKREKAIIFVGGDSSVIHNPSVIYGDFSLVYAKDKKPTSDNVKPQRKLITQNADLQETAAPSKNKVNNKHHKEFFSDFEHTSLISGYFTADAILPLQNTQDYKLFAEKIQKDISFTNFFAAKYCLSDTLFTLQNNAFACAKGNLPPPENC